MTVKELADKFLFTVCSMPDPNRKIGGVYIGDLLSWVMGRADCDDAWITIMSNINVAAVATLADVSCVILAENVAPDEELKKAATEKNINLFTSPHSAYETAVKLYGELK